MEAALQAKGAPRLKEAGWRSFVLAFCAAFAGSLAVVILFILLVDPYGVVPFSLPMHRPVVSLYQRHEYPKIVRSGAFDSFIVGTSTSRLLDPKILDPLFHARFANLAMNSMSAWEQATMMDYFRRHVGAPKVLVVGLDRAWCDLHELKVLPMVGDFPDWLYDDNPWNDYLHLLNEPTVELAARTIGAHFGWYSARVRDDGYGVFTPPEDEYDFARAKRYIWGGDGEPRPWPGNLPLPMSAAERAALSLPNLPYLDQVLSEFPPSTLKILAYMPVHVAAQPWPGSDVAAVETECKERIAAIARRRGAKVIDWRIRSRITVNDRNYWDNYHFRLFIAQRIARELAPAAIEDRPSPVGDYRLVVE